MTIFFIGNSTDDVTLTLENPVGSPWKTISASTIFRTSAVPDPLTESLMRTTKPSAASRSCPLPLRATRLGSTNMQRWMTVAAHKISFSLFGLSSSRLTINVLKTGTWRPARERTRARASGQGVR